MAPLRPGIRKEDEYPVEHRIGQSVEQVPGIADIEAQRRPAAGGAQMAEQAGDTGDEVLGGADAGGGMAGGLTGEMLDAAAAELDEDTARRAAATGRASGRERRRQT